MSFDPRWPAAAVLRYYFLTGIDLNSAAADVGIFTGLPAKYLVVSLTGYEASTSLTTATVDLRTAAAGAGTPIIAAGVLTALASATKVAPVTLSVTDVYQTVSSLYLRNVTPQGGAATASFTLCILELQ